MRTSSLLCFVMLTCVSCSLFQRGTKNSSESNRKTSSSIVLSTDGKTNTVKHTEQLQTQKDSTLADYSIWFWPRGKLTFLPSGGFSGEFDSVQLKGKLKILSNLSESVSKDEQKREIKHENMQADQNKNISSKAVSKTSVIDVKWMFLIVFILFAGLFFWFMKLKFKRR